MGYSPQLCKFHSKHRKGCDRKKNTVPKSLKIGASTIAGAGLGVAAVVLGTTAVSLVGGAAIIHAAIVKLGAGAGLAGGGIGLFKGISKTSHVADEKEELYPSDKEDK
jgi:hypothetical protein